ncbi:hypothetical protein HI914_06174 [Erysiphe necator]|nr:hypothetical protein HI914_06174 [Erysiphe necator]
MADFPRQEPDWPSDDAESTPRQRHRGQTGQSSRPSTGRSLDESPARDVQGIYDASHPATPRVVPARPQLFEQANFPQSTSTTPQGAAAPEFRQMYEVTKIIQQPVFAIVDIDRQYAAKVLEGYIARGSSLTGVDVNLLNVTLTKLPALGQKITVVWLSQHGMPLFDAITWTYSDEAVRPPLRLKSNAKEFRPAPQGVIAKALFFCYFYLLTQAHYPGTLSTGQNVPSFLRNVAGLREPPEYYVRLLFQIIRSRSNVSFWAGCSGLSDVCPV